MAGKSCHFDERRNLNLITDRVTKLVYLSRHGSENARRCVTSGYTWRKSRPDRYRANA
ncbi:hypothetical protein K3G39_01815 [Pontibacter sp. HSC-14F20]|uniref:hypothetical protein n=1 Tax=Pontibacter sp. HSC-14F20 TaxID=2864136 RepID=UPI001C72F149|nr:hypothetical protein [Pontibacter sp. HSC-14F20]MBX0331968.1 hypothetical protein [Pontibacter sp. HSC-14F20]